jgi:hypothetical protein
VTRVLHINHFNPGPWKKEFFFQRKEILDGSMNGMCGTGGKLGQENPLSSSSFSFLTTDSFSKKKKKSWVAL